ncbi:MAG TPA: ABC transporter permease [Acidimicrobiales bacterium]|nr:ABC transporter permease [Acidimicrobiales bacterium]
MTEFLGYGISGVPYGCTYALFAVGLILTYQATGVFNFAFGAQAYLAAFVFTWLTQVQQFPVWAAFVLSVVVLSPALGLIFNRYLFSQIPNNNNMAKVVTGIALFVGIPALLPVFFGTQNLQNAPSILFNINNVYLHVFNTPINGAQLATMVVTAVVLVAMVILLRFTSLGLQMRGAVESRRLVELDGVNAGRVVAVAWAISSFLAGLAGVLLAPLLNQFQANDYATLMVAAFGAAAWGALRSMPIAAGVGILVGVIDALLLGYLPTGSWLFTYVLPSLPFIVLALALLIVPGLRQLGVGTDPLSSVDPPPPPPIRAIRVPIMDRLIRISWYTVLAVFIISMLTWMPRTWENVLNSGLCFATVFLSITLITGMGGQLSLAQGTLAGIGGFTAAQLANHLAINMLAGALLGAFLAAVVAVVLAVLSLRLKGLGLALMTLAAALFFDNSVFNQTSITNGTQGLPLKQSWVAPLDFFNPNGHAMFVLAMVVLTLSVLLVNLVKKGSIGQFLTAMRGSETAAAGIGINLTWQRILVFALSGAVAGIGGVIFTIQQQSGNSNQWAYELSLAFVVIVVTTGVRTPEGAIQGGMGFVITQHLIEVYLPTRLSSLTFVLFAFGALTYAKHPEGILEYQKAKSTMRFQKLLFERDRPGAPPAPEAALAGAPGGPGVDGG